MCIATSNRGFCLAIATIPCTKLKIIFFQREVLAINQQEFLQIPDNFFSKATCHQSQSAAEPWKPRYQHLASTPVISYSWPIVLRMHHVLVPGSGRCCCCCGHCHQSCIHLLLHKSAFACLQLFHSCCPITHVRIRLYQFDKLAATLPVQPRPLIINIIIRKSHNKLASPVTSTSVII